MSGWVEGVAAVVERHVRDGVALPGAGLAAAVIVVLLLALTRIESHGLSDALVVSWDDGAAALAYT